MAKITNTSRETLNFITGVKDGVAITESLKAGETREMAVDEADAQYQGRLVAGLISVDGASSPVAARAARATAPAERRTAQTLSGDAAVRE